MPQHLALLFSAAGLIDKLKGIMEGSRDNAQALLDYANSYEPDDATVNKLFGPDADEVRKVLASSLFIALLLQIKCVENKGCYLSDLVARVAVKLTS